MKLAKNINDNIFRGYDIRGVVGKDIDEDIAYTIGVAFGSKLREEDKTFTVLGHDNRQTSPMLHNAVMKGLIDTGINVIDVGLVTTPMYYYALPFFEATSGMMITASHNPSIDNGFKFTLNGIYSAFGKDIQEFKDFIKNEQFSTGEGQIKKADIREPYIAFLLSSINLGPHTPKIVIDCGNGTGSIIVDDIMKRLNLDYTPLYCDSDSNFPHHHPDPSVENNLTDLKKAVIDNKADVGLAFDGDADRIGLVDENGKMIGVDLYMIIIIRDILDKLTDKRILFDVKCSKTLEDEIIKLGGTPICYRTGSSYIRAKTAEDGILFGGELAGHVFFNDKFYGFDDGIYASLRLLEILSKTGKSISQLLEGINHYYSTTELKVPTPDDVKFAKIDKVTNYCQQKGYKTLTIDGCKALFDDGFALVRASNTGPNITMRFEAKTEARLKEIQQEFENLLKEI